VSIKCTYCGGTEFYEGPSGGLSTNILCANPECRHWFNHSTLADPLEDLHRVEPSDGEKAVERENEARARAAKPARLAAEGFGLYFGGKPASDCMAEPSYGSYAASHDAVLRLCGYIDAMHEHLKGIQLHARLQKIG